MTYEPKLTYAVSLYASMPLTIFYNLKTQFGFPLKDNKIHATWEALEGIVCNSVGHIKDQYPGLYDYLLNIVNDNNCGYFYSGKDIEIQVGDVYFYSDIGESTFCRSTKDA